MSTNAVLSAFMHLQLGICYLVGFGVSRNLNEVREHLSLAAISQYPAIRPLLVRLQEAFHGPDDQNTLPQLSDEMESRNVEILFDATKQAEYSSPLSKISQVWKETQIEPVEIGSELHDAAYFGDFEKAQSLLFKGQSDHITESGFTALILACIDGSLPMVDLLLKHGSDLQVKDPDGYTVWHMLIMFPPDDIPSVAALFHKYSRDANLINTYSPAPYSLPEMFDACTGTPLHWAVHSNNLKAIKALLESGAKTDVKYRGLLSPIELAASLRLHTVLEILCSHAKSVPTDLHEEKPFFYLNECHPMRLAFLHGPKLEESTTKTIELLMQYWDIDAMDSRGWTPLLKLCLTGFSEIDKDLALTLLPKAKNHVDGQQYPLVIASILGCTNKYSSNSTLPVDLIKLDVSVDDSTSDSSGPGYNALHWAAAFQNIAIIQAILAKNPSLVNSRTVSPAGEYPLNIAATQSNSEGLLRTLQTLVEAGADPSAESSEHALTPLGSFISEQEADFDDASFSYLLSISKGSKFLARNEESRPWTALHLAVDLAASFTILENFKPLNLLRHVLQFEDMKGLLESRVEAGFTPILIAALRADYATIRVLAEAGADLTVSSYLGSTCMSILLEQSRRPQNQLANQFGKRWDDRTFRAKWRHAAYRAAMYVSDRLAAIPGYAGLVLPKLHIAAYMCYIDEVKRLLESEESSANAAVGSRSPATARQLLEGIINLSAGKGKPWPEDALADSRDVIDYLTAMEASEAASS
jgi:ankyrin repeat protein